MRHPRLLLLGVTVAALLGPTGSPGLASPASPTSSAVALGDSFISGAGGRWRGNALDPLGDGAGTDRAAYGCGWLGCRHDPALVYGASARNGCDRSDVAPIASAPVRVDLRVNLACSGARSENVWREANGGVAHRGEPPQADQLATVAARTDVELVVLTVGANDMGFGRLVLGCVLAWTTTPARDPGHCNPGAQARLAAAMPWARAGVRKAIREVGAVMRDAGYEAGDYLLLVSSYASPLPRGADIRYPESSWARLHTGGCPVWNADADWARSLATPFITDTLAWAAAAEGARFLDLSRVLAGHELCHADAQRVSSVDPPSAARSEWVRAIAPGQGSLREALHPNAFGQRAIGRCIGLAFVAPHGDWTCRRRGPGIGSAYLTPAAGR